jgi:hypothetical protein
MSYGIIASRSGHLQVEPTAPGAGGPTEVALARFAAQRGRSAAAGRLTLTRLHLSYLPGTTGQGGPPFNVALADVASVEISEGRGLTRVVGIVTASHTLWFRCARAPAFAQAVATAAQDARRGRRATPRYVGRRV